MISLWYEDELYIENINEAMNLIKQNNNIWIVSPVLKFSISSFIRLIQEKDVAFKVMMPIPLEWAKGYLKQHDRLLYDELLWLVEHAQRIHEPLPFSWVTPISYFESETDFSFQRYMAAKEMSYIDDGMCVIAHAKAFASTAPSSVGDIYRMRIREHASKPVYKVLFSEVSVKD